MVRAFYDLQQEFNAFVCCLLRGLRAVVPAELRDRVGELANAGNSGIVQAKQRCSDASWWPGIYNQMRDVVLNREACVLAGKRGTTTVKPSIQPKRI